MSGCCGGSCGTGGGGGQRPGGGGPGGGGPGGGDFRRILRLSFTIDALTAGLLLMAGARLESAALMAGGLGFLAGALNYGSSLWVVRHGPDQGWLTGPARTAALAVAALWVAATALGGATAGVMPDAPAVSLLALSALGIAVLLAVLLFAGRRGGVSARAVWLCARRDGLAQVAVMAAAAGVWFTASPWPDAAVAVGLAGLTLFSVLTPGRRVHPA